VSKRGLPVDIKMRHDAHYVEELSRPNRSIGKILPINQVEPNPEQPRVEIGDLTELTQSIKEKGVLEPLLVKPNRRGGTWMIIAGERRWRAANLAGLREVPCIELDIDEKSIAEIALIENLQRKDLTIWEEADGLAALSEKFGYTHEEIAKKISKSRTTVTESMTIAGLPAVIRERCRESNIGAKSILLEIARQFDEAAMIEFLDKIQNQNLSREEIRQTARPSKTAKVSKSQIQAGNQVNTQNSPDFKNLRYSNPETENNNENNGLDSNRFYFRSESGDFEIQINFLYENGYDKKSVLKALKETFDKIKEDGLS
jgi:ParB family chromosome partitioning protein